MTTNAGRNATSPWQMPFAAWKAVLLRAWNEGSEDNIGLIAAGVAFYGFLALVPLLGAVVLSYGLVAEPATVIKNMQGLTSVMPADAAKLIGEQLMNVVKTSDGKKGLGVLLALGLALFGARSGAGAVVTALNIAYEEQEKRGFIRLNLLSLGITAAAVGVAILALIAIAALAATEKVLPQVPGFVLVLGKAFSYLVLLLVGAAGAATLYRFGPSRTKPRWTWLTPGSLLSALLWLVLTLGFGVYVANFGNYNATYGSLGAVVVMLTWLYLSSYILLFGAELNSEFEHQTAEDTTRGAAKPLGARGAWVADHVAGQDAPAPVVAPAPAPLPAAVPAHEADGSRLAGIVGWRTAGLLPTFTATLGLRLIRHRTQAPLGLAVLGTAAGLAWFGGRRGGDAPEE